MALNAGTLSIDFETNIARLVSDIKGGSDSIVHSLGGVNEALSTVKEGLEVFGVALSVDYFKDMIEGSIEAQHHLNDLSKTTKLSVESLAGLQLAAEESGSNLDSVAQSVAKLSQNMGKTPEAFKALGISAKDPLQALEQFADIFQAIQDPQLRAAAAAQALGKAWQGSAPLLSEGGEEIAKLVEKGAALSGITSESATQATEFNNRLTELKTSAHSLWTEITNYLIPSLDAAAKAMLDAKHNGDGFFSTIGQGLAALFGGDDNLRNQKTLIDQTQQMVELTDRLSAEPSPTVRASIKAQIADLQTQINTTLSYRHLLDQTADDQAKADADAAQAIKDRAASAEEAAKKFVDFQHQQALDDQATRLYTNTLQSLSEKTDTLNNATVYEITLGKLLAGNLATITDFDIKHGTHRAQAILDAAKQQDQDKQRIDLQKSNIQYFQALAKVQEDATNGLAQYSLAGQQNISDMQFQISLIGKTSAEIGKLTAFRQIDQQAVQKEMEFANAHPDQPDAVSNYITGIEKLAEEQKKKISGLLDQQLSDQRDWVTGAKEYFNQYLDDASNAALQTKNFFSDAFQAIDDGLYNFFRHGKAGLSSFLDSVKDMLAKMAAQQVTLRIVASVAGSLGVSGAANAATGATGNSSPFGLLSFLGNGSSSGASGLGGISNLFGGITGAADSLFQNAGVSLGSQTLADIGNYGFGLPAIGGILQIASGNTAGGVGSLIGGAIGSTFGPIGTAVGSFLGSTIGSALFGGGDNNNAQPAGPPNNYVSGLGYTSSGSVTAGYNAYGQRNDGGTYGLDAVYLGGTQLGAVQQSLNGLVTSVKVLASAAGISTDALTMENLANIRATGSAGTLQDSMTAALQSFSDQLATDLIPNLAEFQQGTESLSDTFNRVAGDMAALNSAFEQMGVNAKTAFGGDQASIISNEQSLIAGAGGDSSLASKLSTFYQDFWSDAERKAQEQMQVTNTFAGLGIAAPTTLQQYRELVLQQDLTTQAGQDLFNTLLNLAPAFNDITASADALGDALSANSYYFKSLLDEQRFNEQVALGQTPTFQGAVRRPPGFASGGDFAGGLHMVGESGPELEYTTSPSHIVSNNTLQSLFDSAGIKDAIRQMTDDLIQEIRAGNIAIARNTNDVAKRLRSWDRNSSLLIFSSNDQPIITQAAA